VIFRDPAKRIIFVILLGFVVAVSAFYGKETLTMTYTITPAQARAFAITHWQRDQDAKRWLAEPGRIPEGRNPPIVGGTPFDMCAFQYSGPPKEFVTLTDDGYHLGGCEGDPSLVPTEADLVPYLARYIGASFWSTGNSLPQLLPRSSPDGIPWVIAGTPAPTPTPDPTLPPGWPPGAPPPTPQPTPPPTVTPPALCPVGALCLGPEGRFQVTMSWTAPGKSGAGVPMPVVQNSGLFWFFEANNPELLVKVLDGTAINGKWWVFYASATDCYFRLAVRDSKTGAVKTYTNLQDTMASRGDTEAFVP
jgi:hypothetical protein